MADHSELKKLAESLNRAIEQAEHKPGQWAETAQSMGGICCAGEPFQIGKPRAKEDPWAHFSYKRDSWLAVAAVNALPQLMALTVEVERLRTAEGDAMTYKAGMENVAQQRDQLKAENAGLKTGYEAYEQVNAGLKAEVEGLRKRIDDMSPFKGAPFTGPDLKCLACGGYHYGLSGLPCPKFRNTAQSDLPETRSGQIGAPMGKGEQS